MALAILHSGRLNIPLGSLYFTGLAFAYRYLCSVTGSYRSPCQVSMLVKLPVSGFMYLALK